MFETIQTSILKLNPVAAELAYNEPFIAQLELAPQSGEESAAVVFTAVVLGEAKAAAYVGHLRTRLMAHELTEVKMPQPLKQPLSQCKWHHTAAQSGETGGHAPSRCGNRR